jgi:F-type H+-transporting ATPase subunit a
MPCEKIHDLASSSARYGKKWILTVGISLSQTAPERMYWKKVVLVLVLLAGLPLLGLAAEAKTANAAAAGQPAATEKKEEGVSPRPLDVAQIGPFTVTNSMLVTWAVAIGLIVFAQIATRQIQAVPTGAQNFWEWLVEGLHDFLQDIIGHDLVQKTFWFFASIFIFILFANWIGLIPGVGSIGWGELRAGHFHIERPLLRGANADLNMTFAMSMVFFVCWTVWALQSNGPIGFLKHLFAPRGDATGPLKLLLAVVFLAVGFLEVLSILFRPVSLSFRLFGNIYAGENMLEAMVTLVPWLGWLLPVPFYFMELLVGVVQALVFMLLTAVFTMLICQHDEEHTPAHH